MTRRLVERIGRLERMNQEMPLADGFEQIRRLCDRHRIGDFRSPNLALVPAAERSEVERICGELRAAAIRLEAEI